MREKVAYSSFWVSLTKFNFNQPAPNHKVISLNSVLIQASHFTINTLPDVYKLNSQNIVPRYIKKNKEFYMKVSNLIFFF